MLDKFTSKDPFVPLDVASSSGTRHEHGDTGTTGEHQPERQGQGQRHVLHGVARRQGARAAIPCSSISGITSSDVTFKLIDGQFIGRVEHRDVNVGESVKVVNQDTARSYTLDRDERRQRTTGTVSARRPLHLGAEREQPERRGRRRPSRSTAQTYSDKEEGDTFSTGWGEIKILAINVEGQTVAIMHGDATITLHAGQVVVK